APPPRTAAEDLAPAPSIAALRLASFGDPVALGKTLMLYLQAFDYQSGSKVPYRDLDYSRLEAWLARLLDLDPRGQYPLLAASRLYAEVPVEAKQRSMLEFVYRQFLLDPNRRWPWLAHATAIAKHRLHDLPLALRYARAIQRCAVADNVPPWAKRSEEHTSELQSRFDLVCRLLLEKKEHRSTRKASRPRPLQEPARACRRERTLPLRRASALEPPPPRPARSASQQPDHPITRTPCY